MRVLIFSCIFVAVNALSNEFVAEFMEKMTDFAEKCAAETKASDDDIAELIAHKFPETHEGLCMIFCLYKNFNVLNEDGSFNHDGAAKSMQTLKNEDAELFEKMMKLLETCASTSGSDGDLCITAKNIAQCAIKEGKTMGITDDMLNL